MKNKKFVLDKFLLILCIFSFFLLISFVFYGLKTQKFPEWDEQHYMRMATEFYRILKSVNFNSLNLMLDVVPFRQIGYPLLILPFLFLFGLSNSYFWGIFTNGLLYIATIFGIYFISKNYLSKISSLTASIIFACYSWPLWHAHLTYSETAVSAFCVWAIYFLISSNNFINKNYSIIFGMFLGISLQMKWIALIFILPAVLYLLFGIYKRKLFKQTRLNILLSFLTALIFLNYPYFHNFSFYFQNIYSHRIGGPIWEITNPEERNPISLFSITYYLNTFSQLGIYFFSLFIAGLVVTLYKSTKLKMIAVIVLAAWVFSTYSILKGERYIIPIYPYMAILSASIFDYFNSNKIKYSLIILTILISICSFLGVAWGKGFMRNELLAIKLPISVGRINALYLTSISKPPYIYKITGKEILDYIDKDSKKNNIKNPQILMLFYFKEVSDPINTYNLFNIEKPFSINTYLGTIIKTKKESSQILENALMSDYVIMKTNKKIDGSFASENYITMKSLIKIFENELDINVYYKKSAEFWVYQDSSQIIIYKKAAKIPETQKGILENKFYDFLK